jgi:peptidoglycan/xylan/chitin deacetylase (PgdA/CDA1 family)
MSIGAVIRVEIAMKAIVVSIATLTAVGLAALGMFTAKTLSSLTDHFPTRAAPAASQSATPGSASAPVAPGRMTKNNVRSTPAAVTASDSAATSRKSVNIAACDKPGATGLSRIVDIDTRAGPEFGFQHLRGYDFLGDKEVVLTFDDGPRPVSTLAVLKALQDECLKATFFEIGEDASWHPEITKQVIDAGMTVSTHTWSHKDLARYPYAKDFEKAEQEIEMGNSAVHIAAAGSPVAPFFRFPDLQHSAGLLDYLAQRNIAVFSTDIDSRDFAKHRPEQVIESVMSQLEKRGKGMTSCTIRTAAQPKHFRNCSASSAPAAITWCTLSRSQVSRHWQIRRDVQSTSQAVVQQRAAGI